MIKLFSWLRRRKTRAVLIASIWTAFILFACFIPGYDVPKVDFVFADKYVHFAIFAAFAFFWLATYRNITWQSYIITFLLSVAMGYGVELVQGSGLTIGRGYEVNDVIADTIGGAIGCAIFWLCAFWAKTKALNSRKT